MIKPIWRLGGSKFRLLKKWIPEWKLNDKSKFIDLFGGSLICAVNIKHMTGAKVYVNDFDDIANKCWDDIVKNQTSFAGLGKNFTIAAKLQFERKLKNGFMANYNRFITTLKQCEVWRYKWPKDLDNIDMATMTKKDLVYIDPPYYNKYVGYPVMSFNDHRKLAEWANKWAKKTRIMISYNGDNLEILSLYKNKRWNMVFFNKTNWFAKKNKSKVYEVIIKNYV